MSQRMTGKEKEFLSKLETWDDIRNMKVEDNNINCTCGRKVAEKEDNKVKIKCVKCKQIVEV